MTRPPDDLIETGRGVGFKAETQAPAADLAPWLESFHSYHIRVDPGLRHEELFLPAMASIRIQTYGDDWAMQIGGAMFDPVPRVALFGPSARSGTATVATGQVIGVYLRPAGWARLIFKPADRYTDAIVDLETLWGPAAQQLLDAVSKHDAFETQRAAFEAVLRARLTASAPAPDGIAGIEAAIADSACVTVDHALQQLGMPDWKFARLSRRHFGFTPKLMMRRARFMRTILKIRGQGRVPWARLVDESYVDQSHFIRDCRDFLEMTPVQFANRFQPIAHAAFDSREAALGDAHHLVAGKDEP